jgi:hypothetical protein
LTRKSPRDRALPPPWRAHLSVPAGLGGARSRLGWSRRAAPVNAGAQPPSRRLDDDVGLS